jgi:hypothetical protein
MALFPECTPQCAQNELDTADIVREAMLRQLTMTESGRPGSISEMALFVTEARVQNPSS